METFNPDYPSCLYSICSESNIQVITPCRVYLSHPTNLSRIRRRLLKT
nr:hypothetical protein [uncultured Bacteroides sp.]